MKVGFDKLRIISINPSEEDLMERFPEYEEEDFNYSYISDNQALINIYLENNRSDIFKHSIILKREENHNEKTGSTFYINQTADYQIVKNEGQLFEGFKNFQKGIGWNDITKRYERFETFGPKKYQPALIGEIELMLLLRCIEPHNIHSEETNFFLNTEKIFKGDFSELRRRFMTYADFHVTGLFYVEHRIQKIHKQFMPYNFHRDVRNSMEISGVFKKMYKDFQTNLASIGEDGFYLLQNATEFSTSMLPKKKILYSDEPEY